MAVDQPRPTTDAWQRAVRILRSHDRSEAQLRERLTACGHEPDEVEATLSRLRQKRFLDDERFATGLVDRLMARGHGSERARRDLTAAGIGGELQESLIGDRFGEEKALALTALAKRFVTPLAGHDRGRAGRFLLGRGFPEEVVMAIVGDDDC